ncbi:helix-turn-helix domain-containing protein [Blastococcus sp. TML/M2B]|uniref:helix-turn-helix domain-containing protein n=1 Tax=unclassified Blastococcus TaxID=2619396 RepID=UPI00190DFFC1|nr:MULTISPECIES: helix-turn-helix domain-containing protein [unclassified Blastococcus]MBN1092402.1 helix-turn-helix domain-containing protein [Blastococcus sp. TML/M2B]MBN1097504.1 helix-turn-helix domain-containing protein [Blastococcus sp. TML/C7B]
MQLLDTDAVAPEHRVDAFRAAFDQASVPCRIEHLGPDERVHSRMHLWHFGAANLFTTDASGFRLVRTPRHLRVESPPVVALAVQAAGVGRFGQFDVQALVPPRQLMVSDLTAPYEFSWEESGGSRAFQVPYDLLALPPDVVRRGAPRLRASPLHDLVRDHLERLAAAAEPLAADPGAASLGRATVELVRALLVSAAGDERYARAVREETLLTRLTTYARAHLTEPDLGPQRLAAAHNVSLRRLYSEFAGAGLHLEQWLIAERLERARAQLVSRSGRHRSIAAVARACGFADASHFARRFRQAYGLTPREWQRESARRGAEPAGSAE